MLYVAEDENQFSRGFLVQKLSVALTPDFADKVKGRKIKVNAIFRKIKFPAQKMQVIQNFIQWKNIQMSLDKVPQKDNQITFQFLIDDDIKALFQTPLFGRALKQINQDLFSISGIKCAILEVEISFREPSQSDTLINSKEILQSNRRRGQNQEQQNTSFWGCFCLRSRPSYEERIRKALKFQKTIVYTPQDFQQKDLKYWEKNYQPLQNQVLYHQKKKLI